MGFPATAGRGAVEGQGERASVPAPPTPSSPPRPPTPPSLRPFVPVLADRRHPRRQDPGLPRPLPGVLPRAARHPRRERWAPVGVARRGAGCGPPALPARLPCRREGPVRARPPPPPRSPTSCLPLPGIPKDRPHPASPTSNDTPPPPCAGFGWDSSISEQYPSTISPSAAERVWPYTMDYGIPQNCAVRWVGVQPSCGPPGERLPWPIDCRWFSDAASPPAHQARAPLPRPAFPCSTGNCSTSERHPGLWEFRE